MRRRSVGGSLLVSLLACIAVAAPASAATTVLSGTTISGAGIPCTTQADGVSVCHGTDETSPGLAPPSTTDERFKSVTGTVTTPLEVYVILPPAGTYGAGPYPLIAQNHGYGQAAEGPGSFNGASQYLGPTADTLAREGFAVVQLTSRGFGDSCGKVKPPAISYDVTACGTTGYIRLDDDRYEVRDVQNVIGDLVDEGFADPTRIGTTGESYGGGLSLQLATLKDRIMNQDGSLAPWHSPLGTPLSITAAAPMIPWSDLAYSLAPNGHTLDGSVVSAAADLSPLGIPKQSFIAGLYALGQTSGNYCGPVCTDPQADVTTWFGEINSPTFEIDPSSPTILDTIAHYHSAYYLLDGRYGYPPEPPAPLLIANGFTDDLFPVDEALRYRNLEQSLYPSDPVSLFDWDGGHQRGQNKVADNARLRDYVNSFLLLHLLGSAGASPAWGTTATPPNFTALTQTCPSTAPSGGPYTADSWAALHPGQVSYTSTTAQTVSSSAGDPTIAKAFDPITGDGACASAPAADQGAGVASYRLPAVTGGGYTLLGSPLVAMILRGTTSSSQIAARLLDVNPASGTETLVDRQLYRPSGDGLQYFQLHPGSWHFAAGHVAKLELLGQDAPYGRASSASFAITVSELGLALPVHEVPGSSPVVGTPTRTITLPAPSTRCAQSPTTHLSVKAAGPHGIVLRGTARELSCAHPTATQRRLGRITRVLVSIYRGIAGHRCRFVQSSGRLSGPRRCSPLMTLKAGGTSRWQWRHHLRHPLPKGRYDVVIDAVDGYGHHAVHRGLARTTLRFR